MTIQYGDFRVYPIVKNLIETTLTNNDLNHKTRTGRTTTKILKQGLTNNGLNLKKRADKLRPKS